MKKTHERPTYESGARLHDLGERRIVDDIVLTRFQSVLDTFTGVADDCAVVGSRSAVENIVWTIDPCPTPVISMLGDADLFHWGWMSALISLSDLAAMGARPVGMLVSLEAPDDLPLANLDRYFDGLEAALEFGQCRYLGGNVKEAQTFSATSTAMGAQSPKRILRRKGAHVGDHIFCFGHPGRFWAAVLARQGRVAGLSREGLELLDQALLRPIPRVREGLGLVGTSVATAATDASDGVHASLQNLAIANRLDVVISRGSFRPDQLVATVAHSQGIDPLRLMLSWGNWELVFAAPPTATASLRALAKAFDSPLTEIGEFRPGRGRVLVEENGRLAEVGNFSSLRFSRDSYYSAGLDAALAQITETPLVIQ